MSDCIVAEAVPVHVMAVGSICCSIVGAGISLSSKSVGCFESVARSKLGSTFVEVVGLSKSEQFSCDFKASSGSGLGQGEESKDGAAVGAVSFC